MALAEEGGDLSHKKESEKRSKAEWLSMELRSAGTLRSVVEGGGGKLSAVGADSGDTRKTKPSG